MNALRFEIREYPSINCQYLYEKLFNIRPVMTKLKFINYSSQALSLN